jgi:hypothetical protein
MNLLNISQSILKETKSSNIPTTIIGNTEDVAKQILEVMTVSIIELARSYDWQKLQKEKTFNTVVSQVGYILPEDFDRFINGTFWNTTTQHAVAMPVTPEEWRILNNQGITGGTGFSYSRIRAGRVLLFPTPAAIEAYIYEYISNHVILSSGGTGQTEWLADTDVSAIDSHILRLDATWRWLKNQGRPYAEEQKIANNAAVERVRADGARRTIKHYYYDTNIKVGYPATITP